MKRFLFGFDAYVNRLVNCWSQALGIYHDYDVLKVKPEKMKARRKYRRTNKDETDMLQYSGVDERRGGWVVVLVAAELRYSRRCCSSLLVYLKVLFRYSISEMN